MSSHFESVVYQKERGKKVNSFSSVTQLPNIHTIFAPRACKTTDSKIINWACVGVHATLPTLTPLGIPTD
jgi:hypothetical protein